MKNSIKKSPKLMSFGVLTALIVAVVVANLVANGSLLNGLRLRP